MNNSAAIKNSTVPSMQKTNIENSQTAIKVENLSKIYKLYNNPIERLKESLHPFKKKYHKEFYALKDVNFEVKKGETVGIIGKNGSGKSTLLKIITGVLTPSSGNVAINGKISALLELGTGFNPEFTGLENIYFSGTIMGYTKDEIDKKVDNIISFADIGEFINQPVKTYSSGMFVRLAFAVAINIDPEVLIVDEALSVGDMRFQQKCFRKLREFKEDDKTILLVSHDLGAVINFCDRVIWLWDGEVYQIGKSDNVGKRYISYMAYDSITTNKNISKQINVKTLPEETDMTSSIDLLSSSEKFIEISGFCSINDEITDNKSVYIILKSMRNIFVFSTELQKKSDIIGPYKNTIGFSALIPKDDIEIDNYKIGIYIKKDNREALHYNDKVLDLKTDVKLKNLSSNKENANLSYDNIEWEDIRNCAFYGEGGAEIKRVTLCSKDSYKKLNVIEGNESVVFFIDIEIKKDIYSPKVGVLICDKIGNHILGMTTSIYKSNITPFYKGDRFIVEFKFQIPLLKVGEYFFSPAIGEGTQLNHFHHHWVHDAYMVKVISNDPVRNQLSHYILLENVDINFNKI